MEGEYGSVQTKIRKKVKQQDGSAFQEQLARQANPGLLRSSQAVELKPLTVVLFNVLFMGQNIQLRDVVWKWHITPSIEKSLALQQHLRQCLSNFSAFPFFTTCWWMRALERMSSLPFCAETTGCTHFRRQEHLTFETAYLSHRMLWSSNSS